jgi:hypothetical protein
MKKPPMNDGELKGLWFLRHLRKLNKSDRAQAKRYRIQRRLEAVRAKTTEIDFLDELVTERSKKNRRFSDLVANKRKNRLLEHVKAEMELISKKPEVL